MRTIEGKAFGLLHNIVDKQLLFPGLFLFLAACSPPSAHAQPCADVRAVDLLGQSARLYIGVVAQIRQVGKRGYASCFLAAAAFVGNALSTPLTRLFTARAARVMSVIRRSAGYFSYTSAGLN